MFRPIGVETMLKNGSRKSLIQSNRPSTPIIQINNEDIIMSIPEPSHDKRNLPVPQSPQNNNTNLQDTLRAGGLLNAQEKIFCWPGSVTEKILTAGVIAEHLDMNITQAREIAAKYRKVFAILVLYGKESEIERFMQDDISDEELPLHMDPGTSTLVRKSSPDRSLSCFDGWSWQERDAFDDYQHKINPAFLSFKTDGQTVKHEKYAPKTVLPFCEQTNLSRGGYADVTKVSIDSQCHGFDNALKSVEIPSVYYLVRC
jgi:hypothetical protein